MLKIRRPLGRLIFNMGIAIPGKTVFLIETAPWFHLSPVMPQQLIWRSGTIPWNLRVAALQMSYTNNINPGYGLSLVDTLWNASSYPQPLEQEGNPMTKIEKFWLQISLIVAKKS